MSQARGDVAGGLVMDIDNCSVMAVDSEDRRYCFQITSFDGKNVKNKNRSGDQIPPKEGSIYGKKRT
ncbi:hypothetical protein AB205_0107070 [Aquarana catesbeiana]|uniref:Uncharacterized protein n=1 Tax=Aquarana catesbeiana TaxID=8400 RepID=A0A2G9RVD3_AQUCT|nr:hypothetical protein AB205_0107070 [Aquarana catesbeiana]